MPAHFRLAPSSSHRWIPCPGSAQHDLPNFAGEAAERGTLAHAMSEAELTGEPAEPEQLLMFAGMSDEDQEEMIDAINLFVEYVRGIPGELHSEQQIPNIYISDNGGTIDVLVVTETRLHVVDFKYGLLFVPCEGNTQVMNYLTLARQKFPGRTEFFGTIVQPRVNDGRVDTKEFTAEQLADFECSLFEASVSDEFKAGEHCKYCPLLATCDVAYQHAKEMVNLEFDIIADELDYDRMREILEFAPVVSNLEKLAKAHLLAYARSGGLVEGYKVAQGLGHRKFEDEEKTREELIAAGYDIDKLQDVSLKSPAQMEKLIPKSVVAKYVFRPKGEIQLVPKTSRLEEISFTDEFDIIEE